MRAARALMNIAAGGVFVGGAFVALDLALGLSQTAALLGYWVALCAGVLIGSVVMRRAMLGLLKDTAADIRAALIEKRGYR